MIVVSVGLYSAFAASFVRAAYEGQSWGVIDQVVERHRSHAPNFRDLAYYQERAAMLLNFWLAALVVGFGVALSFVFARPVRFLTRYFNETSHPVNLAMFRIIFFPSLMIFTLVEARALEYSSLPRDFLVPPFLLSGLLGVLPINPELTSWATLAFVVACALATLGLFTRVATVAALLLGLYVLGIQQFYGKVTHYNHLIWFAALFAVSPCSDTLSLDAVYRAWRRRGAARPPAPSRRYGLPLRLTWLLIGVAYFFPGMWKIAGGGGDWIAGDILRQRLWDKWLSIRRVDASTPPRPLPSRLPHYGSGHLDFRNAVHRGGSFSAGSTLRRGYRAFFSRGHPIFHAYLFLDADDSLRYVYQLVQPLENHRETPFPKEAFLVYDAEDDLQLGGAASLRAFDHFGRVHYLTHAELSEKGEEWLEQNGLESLGERGFYFVGETATLSGRSAYRAALARIPFLWLLWPFLGLSVATGVWLYKVVTKVSATKPSRAPSRKPFNFYRLTMVVGLAMIVGNAALGLIKMEKAWPLAAYPSFAYNLGPTVERVNFVKLSEGGVEQAVDYEPLLDEYGEGFWSIVNRALDMEEGPARNARLAELWSVIQEDSPDVAPSEAGRFYVEDIYIDPARWSAPRLNPVDRRLLAEVQPETLVETP